MRMDVGSACDYGALRMKYYLGWNFVGLMAKFRKFKLKKKNLMDLRGR